VSRELADIRLGAGYLDLANDLSRLATLYATHRSELAADQRHYETRDAERAASFAKKIRDEYRAAASRSGEYTELRPRAFSELSRLYNEVRAAAEFLFRNEPAVLDEFPPLRAAAAALSPTRRSKKQADPVPSPTAGDGASPAGSTN